MVPSSALPGGLRARPRALRPAMTGCDVRVNCLVLLDELNSHWAEDGKRRRDDDKLVVVGQTRPNAPVVGQTPMASLRGEHIIAPVLGWTLGAKRVRARSKHACPT